MNAAPFSARLLTNAPLPPWHRATPKVREVATAAAKLCARSRSDIAKLALQFSIRHPEMTTCITARRTPAASANGPNGRAKPIDDSLLAEVLHVLEPIHNWFYHEGRTENNDPLPPQFNTPEYQTR